MRTIYRRRDTRFQIVVLSFLCGFMLACVIIGGYICISI